MATKSKTSPSSKVLLIVVGVSFFLCLIITILKLLEISPVSAADSEATSTTESSSSTESDNESIEKNPGTPIPEIIVGDWRINRAPCVGITRKWVEIVGVEITGGQLPYEVIFTQDEKIIYTQTIYSFNPNQPTEILFPPKFATKFTVNTGSYVDVTIKSATWNGEPLWVDELYFPFYDPTCLLDDE